MLFALDICVNKKAPPTHSVHCGLNPPPHPPSQPQKQLLLLPSPLLNLQTIQAALFKRFILSLKKNFHAPPQIKIFHH